MIAVTRDEDSAAWLFRSKLKKQVEGSALQCIKLKASRLGSRVPAGKTGQKKPDGGKMTTLGELVQIPESHITPLFSNEAMPAVGHAMEDLASGQREGEWIAAFQKIKNFPPQKKRCVGLSKDLDAVRVWGEGQLPKGCNHINFIPIFRPELFKDGPVLFTGFCSFNPSLVESIRRQFNLMSCRLDYAIDQWEKGCRFASPAMAETERCFLPASGNKKAERP